MPNTVEHVRHRAVACAPGVRVAGGLPRSRPARRPRRLPGGPAARGRSGTGGTALDPDAFQFGPQHYGHAGSDGCGLLAVAGSARPGGPAPGRAPRPARATPRPSLRRRAPTRGRGRVRGGGPLTSGRPGPPRRAASLRPARGAACPGAPRPPSRGAPRFAGFLASVEVPDRSGRVRAFDVPARGPHLLDHPGGEPDWDLLRVAAVPRPRPPPRQQRLRRHGRPVPVQLRPRSSARTSSITTASRQSSSCPSAKGRAYAPARLEVVDSDL